MHPRHTPTPITSTLNWASGFRRPVPDPPWGHPKPFPEPGPYRPFHFSNAIRSPCPGGNHPIRDQSARGGEGWLVPVLPPPCYPFRVQNPVHGFGLHRTGVQPLYAGPGVLEANVVISTALPTGRCPAARAVASSRNNRWVYRPGVIT